MKKRDERGNLYLLTALVLGVTAGLIYGWAISPVQYTKTTPNVLRADFKEHYRVLIAQAFLASQDIGRATARLALLGDPDSVVALTLQAQRAIAEGRPEIEIQALTYLMLALSQTDAPLQLPTLSAAPEMPTLALDENATALPGQEATATAVINQSDQPAGGLVATSTASTRQPTPTATPSAEDPFVLQEQTLVCEPLLEAPLLQIETQDAQGKPVPGVLITIQRTDGEGEENFFTGLKPEISLGYADFTMLADVSYTLQAGTGGEIITIETPTCQTATGRAWGSWKLLFAPRE
jgi:hypothetical protein